MSADTIQAAQPPRVTVLAAGLRWLFETEQPEGALLQHHGASLIADDNRTFRFIPVGAVGRAVVVVDVTHIEWVDKSQCRVPANPLEPSELERLTSELADLGARVIDTWNGHPATTGSLALEQPAHPSLLAAVNRYLAGCPDHPAKSVFCDCDWYRRSNARVVPPAVYPLKPSAALFAVADLIEKRGLHKDDYVPDDAVINLATCPLCIIAAINVVHGREPDAELDGDAERTARALADWLGNDPEADLVGLLGDDWNDRPEQTQANVVAVCRKAAAELAGAGQ